MEVEMQHECARAGGGPHWLSVRKIVSRMGRDAQFVIIGPPTCSAGMTSGPPADAPCGYSFAHLTDHARPSPMSMLNIGPEKHAAIAIVGWPERAITTSATRSPTLLPQARTVIPRIEGEMPMIIPSVWRQARSSVAGGEATGGLSAGGGGCGPVKAQETARERSGAGGAERRTAICVPAAAIEIQTMDAANDRTSARRLQKREGWKFAAAGQSARRERHSRSRTRSRRARLNAPVVWRRVVACRLPQRVSQPNPRKEHERPQRHGDGPQREDRVVDRQHVPH